MRIPSIPDAVNWRNGMVLEPSHFQANDRRTVALARMSGLLADPWPWGFTNLQLDETALASGELRLSAEGIMPSGEPFRQTRLAQPLGTGTDGQQSDFYLWRNPDTEAYSLQAGSDVAGEDSLPVARVVYRGGIWSNLSDWSPPTLVIDASHPLRMDINRQLGVLAALCTGFMTTLRLPGAENRPVSRVLGQVAAVLAQGVGVIEALLASSVITPGRVGVEALRLALGVRSAAGIFERLDGAWDPSDQRGSMRRLLYAAEAAASGIGLPFRASVFRDTDQPGVMLVDGMPNGSLLLAIEASRPEDLIAARTWFEGAALAAPSRIEEALTRRVSGCVRRQIERDPSIGISSGPLLALYQVDDDVSWRAGQQEISLAAETPPPANTSFSILIAEGVQTPTAAATPAPAAAPAAAPPQDA